MTNTLILYIILDITTYFTTDIDMEGYVVNKTGTVIMPRTRDILETMGEQIRMARLRRKLSMQLVAERAGISRQTLSSIENGSPTVAIGSYAAVLHALNYMDSDLLLVAKDDEFGRKLQDLGLLVKKRAPHRLDK